MKKKTYLLIDGGHLHTFLRKQNFSYQGKDGAANIATIAFCAARKDEEDLQKILYYDCDPYDNTTRSKKEEIQRLISGKPAIFRGHNTLRILGSKNLFAVRRGELKFRGWLPKDEKKHGKDLSDADFRPNFVQKGVDMRIGLDMAILAERRLIDRLILITGDTDMIPAMKHCRKQAIQIVLIAFKGGASFALKQHSDIVRELRDDWKKILKPAFSRPPSGG